MRRELRPDFIHANQAGAEQFSVTQMRAYLKTSGVNRRITKVCQYVASAAA
jgi:hypothetical protein